MIAPARVAAYEILVSLSAGRADLPTLIAHQRQSLDDERDRALAAEIAAGVQRWRAALDHLIVAFSKRSLDRLDRQVIEILRLSAYQLLHLTRVPASAVVDDAVKLTRRVGKSSAAGFVNAILRTVSRNRAALPLPSRPKDDRDRDAVLDYLSITLSHPRWLVARWLNRFGFDATERWLRFDNEAAPLMLRANPLRTTRSELRSDLAAVDVTVEPARYAPDGLIVVDGHPLRSDLATRGAFLVQDEASQLVPLLAGDTPGPMVLDTCASPGGKTTALAAVVGSRGRVVACDVRERRVDLLRRTITLSGATNVRCIQADLLQPLPFSRQFDTVVVDAPCSGLGTLRRDPDIRWRRHARDLPILAADQRRMLRHAADAVRPGGRLIYSTCSSEPEENEQVAAAFATGGDFDLLDLGTENVVARELIDDRGFFRTLPHVHGLEAFFGAAFRHRS